MCQTIVKLFIFIIMSSLILIVKAMSPSECGDPPYKKRMVTKIAYENSLILCTIITTTPYPPPTPQLKPSLPHNYCCNIIQEDPEEQAHPEILSAK